MSTQRFLVSAHGSEAESAEKAFQLLLQLLKGELAGVNRVVLFVPSLRHLEATAVGEVLGPKRSRALERGQPIRLAGKAIVAKTPRTLSLHEYPEVVLAFYVNQKMLDVVDSLIYQPKALIILPRNIDEVEAWRRTWNPIVLGRKPLPQEDLLSNPVVEEALKALTDSINLGTGLHHPSDKASAESLLWHLRCAEEWVDPASMRAWAVRRGWSPSAADQLRLLAEKTQKRRSSPKGAHSYWVSEDIERFRHKVGERGVDRV